MSATMMGETKVIIINMLKFMLFYMVIILLLEDIVDNGKTDNGKKFCNNW